MNNLEPLIKQLADRIAKKLAINPEYQLIIKEELPRDAKNRERIVMITAGTPPCLIISSLYIQACVMREKERKVPDLRDTLERCLEYIPRMQHTLALVPIADAIALRRDTRKWVKTKFPEFRIIVPDRYFEVTYQVTVKDIITNSSITKNVDYKQLDKTILQAKFDLSKVIIESEEIEEALENAKEIERVKGMESKPNEISIIITENKTEIAHEY